MTMQGIDGLVEPLGRIGLPRRVPDRASAPGSQRLCSRQPG